MLAQRGGQHVVGSLDRGIKGCMRDEERPEWMHGRNGSAVPPNRVAICSGANCEWGLSLLSSFHIRHRLPLIARLDWQGGLFLDSASALLRGGE